MPTGQRQVALLPAPRHRARRHDARRQPAHRPDGGPGRQARERTGFARRAHPLRPRPREHRAQACRAYLDGALDFLFIAPERLSVPGFPEMLAGASPRSSPSTKPTASRNGATTSGPTTACSASSCRCCARARHRAHRHRDAAVQDDIARAARARKRRSVSSTASAATTSPSRSWSAHRASGPSWPRQLLELDRAPPGHRLRADAASWPKKSPTARTANFRAAAYHAGLDAADPQARPGGLPARRARSRRRHHRVRHGHRQGRRYAP